MKLITRETDYALAALCRLAVNGGKVSVGARGLAEFFDVPYGFLRKILKRLAAAGIVESSKGKGGGFSLALPASGISVARVVQALQGPLKVSDCVVGAKACPHGRKCIIRAPLSEIMRKMAVELEGVSVQKLVAGK